MKRISAVVLSQLESMICEILPEVIELRHKIHQNPEVGIETYNTSKITKEFISKANLEYKSSLLGADIIAELDINANQTICLRADIDALPLEEKNDVKYKSLVDGKMHACGHDGHAAIMAGTAVVLSLLKDYLPVNVRFIFQPGEEVIGGGKKMVEMGACDGCSCAYALHSFPGKLVGSISTKEGILFAAASFFEISIKGKSSHGAQPEKGLNPIPIAAQIVSELSCLHKTHNNSGSVISVCSLQAGCNTNVIPDNAVIKGTTRYLSTDTGDKIESDIRKIVSDICNQTGADFTIDFDNTYDTPVINSKSGYELIRNISSSYLLDYAWHQEESHKMWAEDFAFYLKNREGAMFFLGNGEDSSPLHSSTFNFNDNAIYNGIFVFCLIALLQ